jgi:hypothetical protein
MSSLPGPLVLERGGGTLCRRRRHVHSSHADACSTATTLQTGHGTLFTRCLEEGNERNDGCNGVSGGRCQVADSGPLEVWLALVAIGAATAPRLPTYGQQQ